MRTLSGRPALMQVGFSLLEAIVALAIMASMGLALFTWIGQGIDTARRLQVAQQRAALQLQALALVERVNPALQPGGSILADDLTVEWQSKPQEPMRPVYGFLGGGGSASVWQVGLFSLEVSARYASTPGEMVQFQLLRAGWQQAPVVGPTRGSGKP